MYFLVSASTSIVLWRGTNADGLESTRLKPFANTVVECAMRTPDFKRLHKLQRQKLCIVIDGATRRTGYFRWIGTTYRMQWAWRHTGNGDQWRSVVLFPFRNGVRIKYLKHIYYTHIQQIEVEILDPYTVQPPETCIPKFVFYAKQCWCFSSFFFTYSIYIFVVFHFGSFSKETAKSSLMCTDAKSMI